MKSYKNAFSDYCNTALNKIASEIGNFEDRGTWQDCTADHQRTSGRTLLLSEGSLMEKAVLDVSEFMAPLPDDLYPEIKEATQYSSNTITGLLFPHSPLVPSFHFTIGYFELQAENGEIKDHWFSGCIDMTPYYLIEEDAVSFHQFLKACCDEFTKDRYPVWKRACDDYLVHAERDERMGIGGIYFDRKNVDKDRDIQGWFDFIRELLDQILTTYMSIAQERNEYMYIDQNREWLETRRKVVQEFYVDQSNVSSFDVLSDRIEGTKMGLPPKIREVDRFPLMKGSVEEELLEVLKEPRKWV